MTAKHVTLKAADAELIRGYALAAYPEECCGLLLGDGENVVRVTHIAPSPNTAPDPQRHFAIDPQVQFDLMRPHRENVSDSNTRIVGHYHSHPNGRQEPSAEDLRMAHEPGAVWIVAAVAGDAVTLRAFAPGAAGFSEIPIET